MSYRIVPVKLVRRKAVEFLISLGFSNEDSEIAIDVLIEAELRGYGTQGLMRLEQTKISIDNKTINPNAKMIIEKRNKATTLYNGYCGLGYLFAKKAMDRCILLAQIYGVAVVGVHSIGHIGMLSYYSELASEKKMVGIVMTTTSPAAVFPGGKRKVLGTNPISISIPFKKYPLTMDFSTSAISRGMLMNLIENNESLPKGIALDKDGRYTNNPKKALEGGILPFGGIKGALLSLFVGILAGPLVGGEILDRVKGTRFMADKPNKGDLFIAIDIKRLAGIDYLNKNINYLEEVLKECGGEIRMPGKRSYESKMKSLMMGIKLPENILTLLGL